jgi:hypothetical protein
MTRIFQDEDQERCAHLEPSGGWKTNDGNKPMKGVFMFTTKKFLKDSLGWGFVLWLIGFALGLILFPIVPVSMIGWVILPIGLIITLWVLLKKTEGESIQYYAVLAIVWMLIAVLFDYLFIVKAFKPADGYYKLDVYLYYALTLVVPLIFGWWKKSRSGG